MPVKSMTNNADISLYNYIHVYKYKYKYVYKLPMNI